MVNLTMVGSTTHDFIQAVGAFEVTLYPFGNTGGAIGATTTVPAVPTATDLTVTLTFDIPAADSDTYILTIVETGQPAASSAFKFFYLEVSSYLTVSKGP